MPFDYPNAIRKTYTKHPVPSSFIPSNHSDQPQILWVGCSDSLILETECLAGLREQMFVHRNLGALVSNGDLSTTSALEWAVNLLKVCSKREKMIIDKRGIEGANAKVRWTILSSVDIMIAQW